MSAMSVRAVTGIDRRAKIHCGWPTVMPFTKKTPKQTYQYVNGEPPKRRDGKDYGFVVAAVERDATSGLNLRGGARTASASVKPVRRRLISDDSDDDDARPKKIQAVECERPAPLPTVFSRPSPILATSRPRSASDASSDFNPSPKPSPKPSSSRRRVIVDDDKSDYEPEQWPAPAKRPTPIPSNSDTPTSRGRPPTITASAAPTTKQPRVVAPRTKRAVSPKPPIPKSFAPLSQRDLDYDMAHMVANKLKSRLQAKSATGLLDELNRISWAMRLTMEQVENPQIGLKKIVREIAKDYHGKWMPYSVITAASRLLNRWQDGIYTSDPKERWRYVSEEPRRGHMGFIVGEVFINRVPMVDCGIHRAQWVAGIAGALSEGAQSIIVSKSEYNDVDKGDELWYSGTSNEAKASDEMTRSTGLLGTCLQYGKAYTVRVLRTSKCEYAYRPAAGVRYDGLYYVDKRRPLAGKGGNFQYHLTRCDGQPPIQRTPDLREEQVLVKAGAKTS